MVEKWRDEHIWIIWWGFVNMLLVSLYSARGLMRDYEFGWKSIVAGVSFILIGIGMGVYILIQISLFGGLIVIGVFFYGGYIMGLYLAYLYLNRTFPNFLVYTTMAFFFITSVSIMIVSYILASFDDFLGLSITYLIINIIILGYGGYLLYSDIST